MPHLQKKDEALPWYTGDHVFFALVNNGAPKVRASIFDLIVVSFPSLSPSQFRSDICLLTKGLDPRSVAPALVTECWYALPGVRAGLLVGGC